MSRALRRRGWKADLLNWDLNPASQIHYHGEDFRFKHEDSEDLADHLRFYLRALVDYDVFHFSNAHGMVFGFPLHTWFSIHFDAYAEIRLLKKLGKKIVYSNNGCMDGVSQTSFSKWGPASVCSICPWQNEPAVCSDERNLSWGRTRNALSDFQCLLGGNRADYNEDPRVHEVPEFYCLDPHFWRPDIEIPPEYRLPSADGAVRLYHAIGNKAARTDEQGVNIKCSHIYLPLIAAFKREGVQVELLEFSGIPNRVIRYYQLQADIFLDMLTYGWFGATAREAMMLGKPVICFLRQEWLDSARREIPNYIDELPIVKATPATVEKVLRDLIEHPQKRMEIGQRSREFALKWHSADAGARRFNEIYSRLLNGEPQLFNPKTA
ncbi:MAG: glycosyltransferase [Pyrinomonadaceae bacterium]